MPTYPELKSILAFSLAVVSLPFAAGAKEGYQLTFILLSEA